MLSVVFASLNNNIHASAPELGQNPLATRHAFIVASRKAGHRQTTRNAGARRRAARLILTHNCGKSLR